jgi:hypothetical protein
VGRSRRRRGPRVLALRLACRWSCATLHAARTQFSPDDSIYLTEDEWATELANRAVNSVMHIGWVGPSRWLPRADGRLGEAERPVGRTYMAAIRPFDAWIVGPGTDSNDRTGLASAGTDRRRREADQDQGSNVIVSG